MPRTWFDADVTVESETAGRAIVVNSVERAVELLLSWQDRGPAWLRAAELCDAAGEGRASVSEARKAFAEAAAEAGKLLEA